MTSAGPVERAGFTEVLVMGIEIRWISVSARPIATGATPICRRLRVTLSTVTTKTKVSTNSATKHVAAGYSPGECAA
ncbi:hypothetical protein D9M68_866140 [compost metagenome]